MRVAKPQRRRDANPCGLGEATYNGVGEGNEPGVRKRLMSLAWCSWPR